MAQGKTIPEEELHARVNAGIQKGLVASKHWGGYARSKELINGHEPGTIFSTVQRRVVNGKKFFGCGSWDAYLEKFHGVIPIDQRHWSDKRFHHTIATLMKTYPPEKTGWSAGNQLVLRGMKLQNFFVNATYSNKGAREFFKSQGKKFFGHGTWRNYIDWVRKNYAK